MIDSLGALAVISHAGIGSKRTATTANRTENAIASNAASADSNLKVFLLKIAASAACGGTLDGLDSTFGKIVQDRIGV